MQVFWTRRKVNNQLFLNLEEHCTTKSQICRLLFENKEISNHVEITKTLNKFYEFFQEKETKSKRSPKQTLNGLNLPKINNNGTKLLNGIISKKKFLKP